MATASNELSTSAFSSNEEIQLVIPKPVKTPHYRSLDSLTVYVIPRDHILEGWCLKSTFIVQLRRTRKEWLATIWLEGVTEYGTGRAEDLAIIDLVVSLGEYLKSLEERESKLGDSARSELDSLKKLIEFVPCQ